MDLVKSVTQFGDKYEREARLVPALLALLPALVLIVALYREKLGFWSTIGTAAVACGVLGLLAELARQRGKSKEKALWAKWGGAPSTQVLRHSDDTFDMISKEHYHGVCAKLVGKPFPAVQQERAAPDLADALYTAAGNKLREATRDKAKYELLFKDLISYGFRRNGYGLRTIGIVISLCALVWVAIRHGLTIWASRYQEAANIEALLSGEELATVGIALVMLLTWVFFFTEEIVKQSAFTYARSLILTCEKLNDPQPAPAAPAAQPKAAV
ncbi:hypothetical protein [Cupriavidus sp. TMH.W2]|uniref:hypothetical protein n=1 Tax=Cupriavidus sp. TMH.W2 TaxID=3434465 RepID=UPI003D77DDC2